MLVCAVRTPEDYVKKVAQDAQEDRKDESSGDDSNNRTAEAAVAIR